MPVSRSASLLAIAFVFASQSAWAQDGGETASPPPPQESDDEINEIVVYGARLLDRIDAPQDPILELDEADIAAYGAGSIAELIDALGPSVSSGRGRGDGGRPIILVNGVRISSFRELRSYPPEAIERTEVYDEETAQRFGYSADQRVVNIILKDNYNSQEIELEYGQPFAGGFSTQEVEATYLRIDGPSRLNFNLEWNNASPLTEANRGIVQSERNIPTVPGDPDPALYRSLRPDTAGLEATANWSTQLGDSGTQLSLNATYERDDSLRLLGLDTVLLTGPDPDPVTELRSLNALDPLISDRRSNSYSAGAALNTDWGDWRIEATADGTFSDSTTLTSRPLDTSDLQAAARAGRLPLDGDLGMFADAGFEESRSNTYTVNALVTGRTNPLYMPGGDTSLTLITGYRGNGIRSTDTRAAGGEIDLDRSRFQPGANLGIPITSREEDFGAAIGDLTLNLNGAVFEQSDFGTRLEWSTGLIWGVTERLTLSATYLANDVSPSLTQLGAPRIVTPNEQVFDIANNETVLATVTSGGNPLLPVQKQRDWKFGLNWELPQVADFIEDARFQIEYFDNSSRDITSSFPLLTPEIEAAFPGRVTRDATGTLIALDESFVTFVEQNARRLQFGLNLRGSFGGEDGEARGSGGGGRGGERAGGGGGQRGPGGGGRAGEGGGGPDREAFMRMREQFCSAEPTELLERFNAAVQAAANGEEPPVGPDGQPLAIPPRMLERLTGEDGKIDPERFNAMRERFCSADGQAAGGQRPDGEARGGGRGGRGGGGRGGRGFGRFGGDEDGPPQARWFANLNYSLELENSILIAPGLERLDLLDGDALAGGSNPRHSVNWRSGIFYDGYGLLLFARYQGASRIDGSGLPGSTDLFFDDLFTVNLRSFVDLGQRDRLVEAVPFFKDARIGFDIDNLFGGRQRVTDSNGEVPLRYQPFLVDPVGRSFEIEFRKLF